MEGNHSVIDIQKKERINLILDEVEQGIIPFDKVPNTSQKFEGELEFQDYLFAKRLAISSMFAPILEV